MGAAVNFAVGEAFEMAYELYKDVTIVAVSRHDDLTDHWIPVACISWEIADGKRDLKLLTNSMQQYRTKEGANADALSAAKAWIDIKIKN